MSHFSASPSSSLSGRNRSSQREFMTQENDDANGNEDNNNNIRSIKINMSRSGNCDREGEGRGDDNEEEEDDDDDEEEEDSFNAEDRIRRSYHLPASSQVSSASLKQRQQQQQQQAINAETIQVKLQEGYFANERRLLINSLSNVRQKLHSLQLFNPAKNESIKQQAQQEWNEKEKYTLDSLNEFKGQLDERFQWNRPEDGREVWPSKLQYFLAITSYSIGLGNVIRFPILVQKNGGLAFIIPFVIMLLLEGIPLFYLELAIGQRMRKAAISCWNSVSPFAAGIGLASAAVSFLIGLYYNTMVAWTLIYTCAALTNKMPTSECPDNSYVNDNINLNQQQRKQLDMNDSSASEAASSSSSSLLIDECQLTGPFEYRWYRQTLNVTGDVSDWSNFNWPIAICLVAAWLISYICLVKGLSSSKRLVYIISIFPYVILVIFFFKAINLRGMNNGLLYLFAPDWSKLFDPFVWLQAAAQVFFSLGLGFGGLIALSSYNSVNNNCYKDAIKVSLINFVTSILAGVVIFSILGFKATLNYDKCQLEREQQIDFYLADYNLKVLDYGAVFKQVPMPVPSAAASQQSKHLRTRRSIATTTRPTPTSSASTGPLKTSQLKKSTKKKGKRKKKKQQQQQKQLTKSTGDSSNGQASATMANDNIRKSTVAEFIAIRSDESNTDENVTASQFDDIAKGTQTTSDKTAIEELVKETENNSKSSSSLSASSKAYNRNEKELKEAEEAEEEEFSADDAIASINNLDRQLDLGSPGGTFDYGDSDTEFILNASHLIDQQELEQIINNIKQLQKCSIEQELDASTQGTALVFVAIAEAISQFDSSTTTTTTTTTTTAAAQMYLSSSTWAILFFLMILALGLDSQFGNLEGLLSSLTDLNFFNLNINSNTNTNNNIGGQSSRQASTSMAIGVAAVSGGRCSPHPPTPPTIVMVRKYATGAICCLSLCVSVALFAHGAGSYMFAIFDEYASNFSLVLIALFELLTISYIYGLKRFCDDCELMTGKRPPFIVMLSWRYISPILLLIIVFTTIKQFTVELNYDVWSMAAAGAATAEGAAAAEGAATTTTTGLNQDQVAEAATAAASAHLLSKTWPNWSVLFGALLIICCVIWIPLIAVLRIMRISIIPEEKQRCWFPVDELKEFHQLQDQEHQVTRLERILFGFNQDDD